MIRWLERVMFVGAVACATWVFVTWQDAAFFQLYARTELRQLVERTKAPETGRDAPPLSSAATHDSVVGLLIIPRLALSIVAMEGDDTATLRVAAGHLPDTPLPWEDGNASFAGHRDTFFRTLGDVRAGDTIDIATTRGTFRYRVTRSLIVNPDDIWVLHPHDGTALTLMTCYPFSYIGSAPQRFVIHAVRVWGEPSSTARLSASALD